jgi:hypothetical protein
MSNLMPKIAGCDCETDPFDGTTNIKPFIWGYYTREAYREFHSTEHFANFLRDEVADSRVVYFHNGGKFDVLYLLPYIDRTAPLTIVNGRIVRCYIGACEVRDSYSLFNMPLAAYRKDDFDYSILSKGERNKAKNRKKISTYLHNDCKYLYEVVESFRDEYGLYLTQASAALEIWSGMTGIDKPRTTSDYYYEWRDHYHGGRTQAFIRGSRYERYTMFDINSAYPRAMCDYHPWGTATRMRTSLPDKNPGATMIEYTGPSVGCFPYKERAELATTYPDDNIVRTFHITGWEYIAAMELGLLPENHSIVCHVWEEHIEFNEYISYFYAKKALCKELEDKLGEIGAKIFLNSLYGKLGAKPDEYAEYSLIPLDRLHVAINQGYSIHAIWDSEQLVLISEPIPEYQQRWLNVATAASITGHVRATLMRALHAVDTPIYCDTDSVVCRSQHSLDIGKELGQWSIDGEFSEAHIGGKKLYAFKKLDGGWKTATKGARLEPDDIIKVANGEIATYTPLAPSMSIVSGIRMIERNIKMT